MLSKRSFITAHIYQFYYSQSYTLLILNTLTFYSINEIFNSHVQQSILLEKDNNKQSLLIYSKARLMYLSETLLNLNFYRYDVI
jgi:hypothetical protein